jgi:hypothetical protein
MQAGHRVTSARYQFRLRSLLVLITLTAVFCSAAVTLGYVDAIVCLAALIVAGCLARWPQSVRPTSAVLMTLGAAILLWANLRPTGWDHEFQCLPPQGLDPITQALFWRGWPLCPCMFSLIIGLKFHSDGASFALLFDAVVFLANLIAVKVVSERTLRWFDKRTVPVPP